MEFRKIFESKGFRKVTRAVAILIVLLIVFRLGVAVGYRRAAFSYRWGENYHLNFAGPRGGFFQRVLADKSDFIGPHGTFGQIIKIDYSPSPGAAVLVVRGRAEAEKIVLVNDRTIINRLRGRIEASDLKTDDNIVVIGEPNQDGQIEARLIRVIPSSAGELLRLHP